MRAATTAEQTYMTHDGNSGNTGDITTLSDQIQACVEACVQARLEALGALVFEGSNCGCCVGNAICRM